MTGTRLIWHGLRPRLLALQLMGTLLLAAVASIALPWPLKLILEGQTTPTFILGSALLYLLLGGARAWLMAKRHSLAERLTENLGRLLSHSVLHRITHASLGAVDSTSRSELSFRLVDDIERLKQATSEIIEGCALEALVLVGAVFAMGFADWKFALFLIAGLLPLYFGFRRFLPQLHAGNLHIRELDGQRVVRAQDILQNLETVKAFGKEGHEQRAYASLLRERARAKQGLSANEGKFYLCNEGLGSLSLAVVFGYGGWRVSRGSMTTGELLLFIQYTFLLQGPVTRAAHFSGVLQRARASLHELEAILALPAERKGARYPVHFPRELEFKEVSFAHPRAEPLLDQVNFTLRPGDHVALVGASGCGKTTLLRLLLQFEQPISGQILSAGTDISELGPAAWRRWVAYMGQQPGLFARTVRENLLYGVDGDRNSWQRERHLRRRLETGVGTLLPSEAGIESVALTHTLSGGEKQRLALVRAMIRDAHLLILDEPSSALDLDTENRVIEVLKRRLEDPQKITLFVTHRPSLLKHANRVVTLRGGKLLEHPANQEALS